MRSVPRLKALLLLFVVLFGFPAGGEEPRYVYILSKPQTQINELGPTATALHYGLELSWKALMTSAAYLGGTHAGGHGPEAMTVYFVAHLPETYAAIQMQTRGDLELRQKYQSYRELQKMASMPYLNRIALVTTSKENYAHGGTLTQRLTSDSLVIIETTRPLDTKQAKKFLAESWDPKWGTPIRIDDPDATKIRLRLNVEDRAVPEEFAPTLSEILNRKETAPGALDPWKNELNSRRALRRKEQAKRIQAGTLKEKGTAAVGAAQERIADPFGSDALRIDASIVFPDGRETPLGVWNKGEGVVKFLGMSRLQKILKKLRDEDGTTLKFGGEEPGKPSPPEKPAAFDVYEREKATGKPQDESLANCLINAFWKKKLTVYK